jgi:hypothetical protein
MKYALVFASLCSFCFAVTRIDLEESHIEQCDPSISALSPLATDAQHYCSYFPYEVCNVQLTDCEHKGIFPILPSEYIGLIIMPLLLGIASLAGLGGGVVFVPLMMAFFHFKTKDTVAMSLAIVFESGVIRTFLFSWWAKHPERPTTEIDFNTIRVV